MLQEDESRTELLRGGLASLGFSERLDPWDKVREAVLAKALCLDRKHPDTVVRVSNRFSRLHGDYEVLFWEAAAEHPSSSDTPATLIRRSTLIGVGTDSDMTIGPRWAEAQAYEYLWWTRGYHVSELGGMVTVRSGRISNWPHTIPMLYAPPDDRVSALQDDLSGFVEDSLQAVRRYQEVARLLRNAPKEGHFAVWQAAREYLAPCNECHGERWNHANDRLCEVCSGSGLSAMVKIRKRSDRHYPRGVAVDLLLRCGHSVALSLNEFNFGLQGCCGVRVEELPPVGDVELTVHRPRCGGMNAPAARHCSCRRQWRVINFLQNLISPKLLGLLFGFFIVGPIIAYFGIITFRLMRPIIYPLSLIVLAAAIGIAISLYIRDKRTLKNIRTRKMKM